MAKKPKKKPKPPIMTDADLSDAIVTGIREAFATSTGLQSAIRQGIEDGISTFLQRTFSKAKE